MSGKGKIIYLLIICFFKEPLENELRDFHGVLRNELFFSILTIKDVLLHPTHNQIARILNMISEISPSQYIYIYIY